MDLKTMKFAGALYAIAADRAGQCCNDTNRAFLDSFGFTDEEKIGLAGEYITWNCKDPNDIQRNDFIQADDAGKLEEFYRIHDDSWMAFFAAKLSAGKVYLTFPLCVYPHFGLPDSREIVTDPQELSAAIARGIQLSPIGEVSLGNV